MEKEEIRWGMLVSFNHAIQPENDDIMLADLTSEFHTDPSESGSVHQLTREIART